MIPSRMMAFSTRMILKYKSKGEEFRRVIPSTSQVEIKGLYSPLKGKGRENLLWFRLQIFRLWSRSYGESVCYVAGVEMTDTADSVYVG